MPGIADYHHEAIRALDRANTMLFELVHELRAAIPTAAIDETHTTSSNADIVAYELLNDLVFAVAQLVAQPRVAATYTADELRSVLATVQTLKNPHAGH